MNDRTAIISAPKQRLLLAILLSRANTVISSAQLLDALWGEAPPKTARKNLQVYVSALRKIVGDRIHFHGWGYRFRAERDELDLLRFQDLITAGRTALRNGDRTAAAELLGEAVRMWQGPPLAEFAHVPLVAREADRFAELFLSVYEDWAELEIELGRCVEVLTGLDLIAEHFPTRERIAAARMTALTRCGRSCEALAQYETLRRHLAVEMGIDPSPMLQDLYQKILRGEEAPPGGTGRTSTAPPLRAAANQLPRDITDFVGRETEVRAILRDRAPVTLITGEPGIGKTTLAVHVAHLLAPEFPDGVMMVALQRQDGEQRDPADVQREILKTVGLDLKEVRDRHVLASIWRSWLANRRVLLILDGVADESSARLLLPGTAASKVLMTSGSWLSGLESVARIVLGELSADEGVAFVASLIGRERVLGELPVVMDILARYGRSPLVLRLLCSRFAKLPHMPLSRIAERLRRAPNVLDEFAAGDIVLRERFDRCYNRPTWPLRSAFIALGTLAGPPFDHEELVTALRDGPGPAERVIESLLEANVLAIAGEPGDAEVTAHSMRYRMSALAHRFAAELSGRSRL